MPVFQPQHRNYFEIAYALNRQFGRGGIYQERLLYSFADNHDVNRVASSLAHAVHLYPLYCLLFTIPGVPSLYYGSEWGVGGRKDAGDDAPLRPCLDLSAASGGNGGPDLAAAISRLAAIRKGSPALQAGSYEQLHVSAQQLAFCRRRQGECVIVAVNADDHPVALEVASPTMAGRYRDLLNPGDEFVIRNGKLKLDPLHPNWARVLHSDP